MGGKKYECCNADILLKRIRCIATDCTACNMYEVLQHVSANTHSYLQGIYTKSSIVKIHITVEY